MTVEAVDVEERQERDCRVAIVDVVIGAVDLQHVGDEVACVSITPFGRPVVPLE